MKKGRVLACSDLHGRYDLWEMIKNYLKPEDTLYVLGDCCDRGPKGFEVMKEVLEHPQTIYIKGNHEYMFVDAILRGYTDIHNWNGGKKTRTKWKYKYGANMSFVHQIDKLPLEKIYINKRGQRIVLTHAGYTPHLTHKPSKKDLLWGRYHIGDFWWENEFSDTYIIHGHTMIPYINEFLPYRPAEKEAVVNTGVFWYCPDESGVLRKCDIDCGVCLTDQTAVINLDTFEVMMFKV